MLLASGSLDLVVRISLFGSLPSAGSTIGLPGSLLTIGSYYLTIARFSTRFSLLGGSLSCLVYYES